MSNKASSFQATASIPPLHRFGGVLASTPQLALSAIGDIYWIEGTGTVTGMPAWPKGPPILLIIPGSPTFVDSTKLLMPGRQNYTFSPGDSAWIVPLGDGTWRVISISRADGIPYLPGGKTLFPPPQGRLTLTSGVPVTSSDVTGATSVIWTQKDGDMIALYDATTSTWIPISFSETSLSLSGATAGTNFDVFSYLDTTRSFAMETLAWTNDTTRATAIATQNGIDVKSGDPTRRLLGTIRTTGITGQTADTKAFRFVSNRYNAEPRDMKAVEATASWPYSSGTYRQANGNAANQLDFVYCMPRMAAAEVLFAISNTVTFGTGAGGIGIDSTTTDSSTTRGQAVNPTTGGVFNTKVNFAGSIAAGRHTLVWLESGAPSGGTMTFYGAPSAALQCGITGTVIN